MLRLFTIATLYDIKYCVDYNALGVTHLRGGLVS